MEATDCFPKRLTAENRQRKTFIRSGNEEKVLKDERKRQMKKNESGRSMVEMLGVLAIIGVLSVGGIAGYTMAMNRYRANEVIDYSNKYAVIAYSAFMTAKMMNNGSDTAGQNAIPEFKDTGLFGTNTSVNGTTIGKASITGENAVSIELTFDSPSVCRAAATSLGIKPDSTSTVDVTNKETGAVTQETVTAGCSSNKKLTYVFTQS